MNSNDDLKALYDLLPKGIFDSVTEMLNLIEGEGVDSLYDLLPEGIFENIEEFREAFIFSPEDKEFYNLIGQLKDKNKKNRINAVKSLSKINDKRVVWPIITAHYDKNKDVVKAAENSLKGIESLVTKKNRSQAFQIVAKSFPGTERDIQSFEELLIFDYDLSFGGVHDYYDNICEVTFILKINTNARSKTEGPEWVDLKVKVKTFGEVTFCNNKKWVIQREDTGHAESVKIDKILDSNGNEIEEAIASDNPVIYCKVCCFTEKYAYTHFLFLFFYVYIWGFEIFRNNNQVTGWENEGAGDVELVDALNREKPLDDYADIWLKHFFIHKKIGFDGKEYLVFDYIDNQFESQMKNDAVAYFEASQYLDTFGFIRNPDIGRDQCLRHSADVIAHYFCYDKLVLGELYSIFNKVSIRNGERTSSQKGFLVELKEYWEI